jgi:DeoR/GlpR family transcriptional regulator of sugar metabolism
MLAETRRIEIAERLKAAGAVTIAEVGERYGVSRMTARRDLAELERRGVVRRTHGGADRGSDPFMFRAATSGAARSARASSAARMTPARSGAAVVDR